jgi:hypothetical protein
MVEIMMAAGDLDEFGWAFMERGPWSLQVSTLLSYRGLRRLDILDGGTFNLANNID